MVILCLGYIAVVRLSPIKFVGVMNEVHFLLQDCGSRFPSWPRGPLSIHTGYRHIAASVAAPQRVSRVLSRDGTFRFAINGSSRSGEGPDCNKKTVIQSGSSEILHAPILGRLSGILHMRKGLGCSNVDFVWSEVPRTRCERWSCAYQQRSDCRVPYGSLVFGPV